VRKARKGKYEFGFKVGHYYRTQPLIIDPVVKVGGLPLFDIGVYRPSTGRWCLDRNGDGKWNGCGVELCVEPFGVAEDQPVAGAW
jgi:hypothetical protein